jgi:hypothetical protein
VFEFSLSNLLLLSRLYLYILMELLEVLITLPLRKQYLRVLLQELLVYLQLLQNPMRPLLLPLELLRLEQSMMLQL